MPRTLTSKSSKPRAAGRVAARERASADKKLRIGLAGFGTVGRSVAKLLCADSEGPLHLAAICVRNIQKKKVDWQAFIQAILDATDWPGAQKFIVDMTDQDLKNLQAKNEAMQANNQIALKHAATMDEIEQKGRAQAGTHIIRALMEQMDPSNRVEVMQMLQQMQQPGADGQPQPPGA